MSSHRLYSGTALLITAAFMDVLDGRVGGIAVLVMLGVLLILTSFSPEGERR